MVQQELAQPSMYCRQCGYALFGLSANRCPECGRPFNPADPRTFFRHPRSYQRRRWIKRIALAVTAVVLLAAIFVVACFGWVYWQYHADWQAEQEALAALKAEVGPRPIPSNSISLPAPAPVCWVTARVGYLRERISLIGFTGDRPIWTNLAHLAAFKQCTWAALDDLGITDDQLRHLEGMTQLTCLDLSSNPAITDDGLAHLRGLTSVRGLDLKGTSVSGAGLRHLQGMTRLTHLNLTNTRVQGRDLAQLSAFPSLAWLQLEGLPIADAHLIHLKPFPLTCVNLKKTGITDAGLAEIGQLIELKHLDLSSTAVTDAGLQHLIGLGSLNMLLLDGTAVTDAGLKHLEGPVSLRYEGDSGGDPETQRDTAVSQGARPVTGAAARRER